MAYMKFGFITSPGGNATGHGQFLSRLRAAGIPISHKGNDAMPMDGQQLAGPQDTIIYRRSTVPTGASPPPSGNPDVPNYRTDPDTAAAEHWAWHRQHLPPELDRDVVWIEVINEPAQHFDYDSMEELQQDNLPLAYRQIVTLPDGRVRLRNAEWLAVFAEGIADLAVAEGYKVALFGFSMGEPEIDYWTGPYMLSFLYRCAQNPDRLAVALHEYSGDVADIWRGTDAGGIYWLVGRFEHLVAACDSAGIGRPTILITEFGWTHEQVPAPDAAMLDLEAAGALYAQYACVRAATIWYLGQGFGGIANLTQRLIAPLGDKMLVTRYPDPPGGTPPPPSPADCPAITPGRRVALWVPPFADLTPAEVDQCLAWARDGFPLPDGSHTSGEHMLCPSHQDALLIHTSGEAGSVLGVCYPHKIGTGVTLDWITQNCPCAVADGRQVVFLGEEQPQPAFTHWPADQYKVTQWFGANPQNYAQFGLPGHDGIDIVAPTGAPLYAVMPGRVYHVESNPAVSNYGIHVRIEHADGWLTTYAHLQQALVVKGQDVTGGELIGYANNSGNSFGSHLHLTLKQVGATYTDENGTVWPSNLHDPWLLLRPLADAYLQQHGWLGFLWADSVQLNMSGGHGRANGNLNLRESPSKAGALVGVVPSSSIVRVIGQAVNGYLPVLAPISSTAPPPPPPAPGVPALIGLHASADPGDLHGGEVEYLEFRQLRPGVIKVLDAHSETAVRRLAAEHPGASWIVRIFQHWGGRNITPRQFFDWTKDNTLRTVHALLGSGVPAASIIIEVHNEPNLAQEGWLHSWANGFEFGQWLRAVVQLLRPVLPAGVRLAYPGLSPGGDVPGVRYDSGRFLAEGAGALAAVDALCVHAYWSDAYPMTAALAQVDAHQQHGLPVWVTEASRNDRPAAHPPETYAQEYVAFWRQLRNRSWVRGVTYFVASASDPTFEPEAWIAGGQSKGIAGRIGQLMPATAGGSHSRLRRADRGESAPTAV